ncbi:MAG: DUF1150 family protein [Salaquimonas sp.]
MSRDSVIILDENIPQGETSEFLSLGEGQIGYIRELGHEAMAELPVDINLDRAWGVFSATGEALALCDSPNSAWLFFADHELQAVSVH